MSRSGRVVLLSALVALIVVVAACDGKSVDGAMFGSGVKFVHDAEHEVSCWIFNNGVSCLPDSQVKGVKGP